MVGEQGPIVAQDNGQRYRNFPILFYPIVYVETILGPQSLSFGLARFVPMRKLRLVGLDGVASLRFVGRHFVAVGTKGHWGMFLSAAATTAAPAAISAAATTAATAATDAILGHGREEIGVLFHNEIKLLALGL